MCRLGLSNRNTNLSETRYTHKDQCSIVWNSEKWNETVQKLTEQAWDCCPKKAFFARLVLGKSLLTWQVNSSPHWYKAFPKDPHLGKWRHHGTDVLHNPDCPAPEAQLVSDKLSLLFKPFWSGVLLLAVSLDFHLCWLTKNDSEIIGQSPVSVSQMDY